MLRWLLERFHEPSTWGAAAALGTLVAYGAPIDWVALKLAGILLAASGIVGGVVLPERK